MRLFVLARLALVVLVAGCGRALPPEASASDATAPVTAAEPAEPAAADAPAWHLASGSEGTALDIDDGAGGTVLRLWCKRGEDRLRVNVPGFVPIGSEERMSFGQDGEVIALVADTAGDATRGGITAEASVPANLSALLSGPVSASYGTQACGPHPGPPPAMVSEFVVACMRAVGDTGAPSSAAGDAAPASPSGRVSACLVQDGREIPANRLRAVGIEPFWGAEVEGRCVTYSHPEDPTGTRVWTRFSGTADAGTWTGALDGNPFVMRTRPQPGCSDGMSDTRYPIAVSLTVGGEERRGCASLW